MNGKPKNIDRMCQNVKMNPAKSACILCNLRVYFLFRIHYIYQTCLAQAKEMHLIWQ